jgi:prepilin-type N-terminal cleavage/methylation domain-containing protein
MRPKYGFTLLEVLLAASLLAAVAVAIFSWTTTQVRVNRAAEQRLQANALAETIAAAIRDDLRQSLPDEEGRRYLIQGAQLKLITMNYIPGEVTGSQHIVWRNDEKTNAIIRERVAVKQDEKNVPRLVSSQVTIVGFSTTIDKEVLVVTCRSVATKKDFIMPLFRLSDL